MYDLFVHQCSNQQPSDWSGAVSLLRTNTVVRFAGAVWASHCCSTAHLLHLQEYDTPPRFIIAILTSLQTLKQYLGDVVAISKKQDTPVQ